MELSTPPAFPDLFVFYQPTYSKQELNGDSQYILYTTLIRAIGKIRPQWQFFVVFPDAKSGYKYEDDGFFRSHNVTRLAQRISTSRMRNSVTYDASWYKQVFQNIGFDLILSPLVEITPQIKRVTECFDPRDAPVAIACHNYVIHESLPYLWAPQEHIAMAQVTGALLSDWNVFNSEHTRSMLMDNVNRWFKPEMRRVIDGKASFIPHGTLPDTLTYRENDNEVPVIIYNHRLQNYKDWRTTFDLFLKLYTEGHRFIVRYTSNCTENVGRISRFPFVDVQLNANHAEYLEVLKTGDINVTNSKHETFCISAIESMACGQALLAPDGITFPEITGRKTTKYPYLFRSSAEQETMLIKLLKDATERRRWGRVLSDYVRAEYNAELWAKRYVALLEERATVSYSPADDAWELFVNNLRQTSGLTSRQVYTSLAGSKAADGRSPYAAQSMSMRKLIGFSRMAGANIVWDRGKQRIKL